MHFTSASPQYLFLQLISLTALLHDSIIPQVLSSNILFFHLVATPSHRISVFPLAEKLADNGHHVTYIFPMENPPGHHPRIEELTPSKMIPIMRDYVGNFDINFRLNNTVDQWTSKLFSKCLELCEAFYDSPETQKWLARPNLTVSLILLDAIPGDCVYGLVHRFKAKHILFTPVIPHFIWDAVGIIPESGSIPEGYFHRKPSEMGFFSRLVGTWAFIYWRFAFEDFLSQVEIVIRKKMNYDQFPSLLEFERNTSLVFVNSFHIEDYAMALPPMIQSYSGLWCSVEKLKQKQLLPEDVNRFISDNNTDGFVYISFGSSVVSSAMPVSERAKFFQTFQSFPKLKFLWKWDGPRPDNTPENVLLLPWFPQRTILAHSKIQGFITQAGRPSTQEALCHGVPMIAIPIFADQDYNANRLEYIGAAINLDIGNLTVTTLHSAITTIVYADTYKTRMRELSNMFRDRPLDPLQNAVYWTEYVLRYDTTHLKPLGMKQSWYTRRLLDVYLFFGILIASFLFGIFYLFKILLCRIFLRKKIKIN